MVRLGKTFIMVIEPEGFNINGNIFYHKELEFVVGSESKWFRDSIASMLQRTIEIWQQHYSPAILRTIQEYIGGFIHSKVKREEVILPFIGGLGSLVYYISVNQHSQAYLKSFMVMDFERSTPMFYCYAGTKNHTSNEIIATVMKKISQSKHSSGQQEGYCFILAETSISKPQPPIHKHSKYRPKGYNKVH